MYHMVTVCVRIKHSDYKRIRGVFPGEYGETAAHYFMRLRKFLEKKKQTEEGWGMEQGE